MEFIQKHKSLIRSNDGRIDCLDSSRSCARCGGFLVLSFCVAPDEGAWEFQIPVARCLQCGDLVDSTILKNRQLSHLHHSIN